MTAFADTRQELTDQSTESHIKLLFYNNNLTVQLSNDRLSESRADWGKHAVNRCVKIVAQPCIAMVFLQ